MGAAVVGLDGGSIMGKLPLLEPFTLSAPAEEEGGGGGTDRNTEGSSTNNGYRMSAILNLVAKSLALVKVILYSTVRLVYKTSDLDAFRLTRHP